MASIKLYFTDSPSIGDSDQKKAARWLSGSITGIVAQAINRVGQQERGDAWVDVIGTGWHPICIPTMVATGSLDVAIEIASNQFRQGVDLFPYLPVLEGQVAAGSVGCLKRQNGKMMAPFRLRFAVEWLLRPCAGRMVSMPTGISSDVFAPE